MGTLFQDLRFGIRWLLNNKGVAASAVLTLALAIGVNTAIFSLVNVVLFSELPMSDPESFVFVWSTNVRTGQERSPTSIPDFVDFRAQSRSFESLAALAESGYILTGSEDPMRVSGRLVTDNLLAVWGIEPLVGRGFLPGEGGEDAERVVMLSHGFWQRHFAADPAAIGTHLRLDGEEYAVVGVMTTRMEFGTLAEIDVYVPLNLQSSSAARDERRLGITGRLRPGVTVAQANDEIGSIATALAAENPATNAGWNARVIAVSEEVLTRGDRALFLVLILAVAFVMATSCVNIANMLIARSIGRRKEIAVRIALGASRYRLLRQLLTENLVIAALAAGLGFLLARSLLLAFVGITNSQNALFRMAELDATVLLFMVVVSAGSPLIFGLVPAVRASQPDLRRTLTEHGGAGGGRRGLRLQGILVIAQMSMAVMLMVVAGLSVRTLINLQTFDFGFETADILSMRVDLPEPKYPEESDARLFFEAVVERLAGVPGVVDVALAGTRPLVGLGQSRSFAIDGHAFEDWETPSAFTNTVSPGFFELTGIPVFAGRNFTPADIADSNPVALVNRAAASRYWPDEDPLLQRIRLVGSEPEDEWLHVIGVVGDVHTGDPDNPEVPQLYLPFAQNPAAGMALLIRTSADPLAFVDTVRAEVWALDPDQPIDDVRTIAQIKYDRLSDAYVFIAMFVVFAGFALAMASAGIYGVMSYSVGQRTREIGVRMALGAHAYDVMKMIVRHGLALITAGVALGLVGAYGAAQLMAGILFEVSAFDPLTFLGVPTLLVIVAMLANYLPARRATRIDPMASLRSE